ncbi:hypothetical protein ACHAQH_007049 [Verticillium albo-atrum]
MAADEVKTNGWSAVPVDAKQIFDSRGPLPQPAPVTTKDINFPSDNALVAEVQKFVQERLSAEAYNHSMRVFYWGSVIAKQLLPEHATHISPVTWALTCLLHDIGTAEEFWASTRMSFDLYGGIKAMEVLKTRGSTQDQAEAVAEAIIRHQDIGVDGTISFLGQLIQLSTLYDNVGRCAGVETFGDLVHEGTRDNVNEVFPRMRWGSVFAATIRKEEGCKPWCHSTHIPQFDVQLEDNALMKKWE